MQKSAPAALSANFLDKGGRAGLPQPFDVHGKPTIIGLIPETKMNIFDGFFLFAFYN